MKQQEQWKIRYIFLCVLGRFHYGKDHTSLEVQKPKNPADEIIAPSKKFPTKRIHILGIQSPKLSMVMEPKYLAFRR